MSGEEERVKWEELFKHEFEERLAHNPVVYLPMGICEPHGHISVLGLDTIKANYLCEEAARRWGGIVAPTQGYQIHETGYHAPWLAEVAGNVSTYMTAVPPAPMLYFFLYQLRAFHNAGFRQAIVITGHAGGNQEDFRLAAQLFCEVSDMQISVFSDPELTNGKYTGDHAGKYEISQLLYLRPEFIDLNRISNWQENEPETRFAQGPDAAEATAEFGRQIMKDCLAGIHRILEPARKGVQNGKARNYMGYEPVESVWSKLKAQSSHWVTASLKEGQDPAPIGSIWKKYEQYTVSS